MAEMIIFSGWNLGLFFVFFVVLIQRFQGENVAAADQWLLSWVVVPLAGAIAGFGTGLGLKFYRPELPWRSVFLALGVWLGTVAIALGRPLWLQGLSLQESFTLAGLVGGGIMGLICRRVKPLSSLAVVIIALSWGLGLGRCPWFFFRLMNWVDPYFAFYFSALPVTLIGGLVNVALIGDRRPPRHRLSIGPGGKP